MAVHSNTLLFVQCVTSRNAKFTDGLAQSRLRFVADLENLFGTTGPLEETLEKLEEVRLCRPVTRNYDNPSAFMASEGKHAHAL